MRRKVGLFVVCGLMLPLVVTATAGAQGSTLQVDVPQPTPGQVITVTGNNFSGAAGNSPVNIRLSTRGGQVLASATPNSAGNISATFPVPPGLSPGWYLILATQTTTANGRHRAFTPGRTRIRVRAASRSAAAPPARGGGGLPGSPLGLVAVCSVLVLLATGATLTARRTRTLNRPQVDS